MQKMQLALKKFHTNVFLFEKEGGWQGQEHSPALQLGSIHISRRNNYINCI